MKDTSLINNMIAQNLWDEARVFQSKIKVDELPGGSGIPNRGIKAPQFDFAPQESQIIDEVRIEYYYNKNILK